MVEIPNGQIYPVSQGSYMGYNFGKVAGISDKGIHIQEIVLNKRAKWERRRAFLAFSQPKH
jgi:type IV pilus assembly protein PilP